MCIVTYIPRKSSFILSSSRDESIDRPTLKPEFYNYGSEKLVYPKDGLANGTWIAASVRKKIACLLNGAFGKHDRLQKYSKSRGIVLLDSFGYTSMEDFAKNYNLKGVEPFTLLGIDYAEILKFEELIWDGSKTHLRQIDSSVSNIWLSAYLYSKEERKQRKEWFKYWLGQHKAASDAEILDFHLDRYEKVQNSKPLILQSGKGIQTLSISQISVDGKKTEFYYFELDQGSGMKIDVFG